MAVSDLCTGLPAEELLALDWTKIYFERLCMKIDEAVVHGRLGPVKTKYSEHFDDHLAIRKVVPYTMSTGFRASEFRNSLGSESAETIRDPALRTGSPETVARPGAQAIHTLHLFRHLLQSRLSQDRGGSGR
jgi:hypothetical protein